MLTQLRFQNFKSWHDTGSIRFAPLTVFFGPNSSGKTSIHQLLLLLKQTAESSDRRRVLHFGDRNSVVDLGTFHEIIFNHEEDSTVAFELTWKLPRPLDVEDPLTELKSTGENLRVEAEIRRDPASGHLYVEKMGYTLASSAPDQAENLYVGMRQVQKQDEVSRDKYELETRGYEMKRRQGRAWPLPAPMQFHGFPDQTLAYYQNAEFVSDFELSLQNLLQAIHYVGPLRNDPQRTYVWPGQQSDHVGRRGEQAIEALLGARERKIQRASDKHHEPLEKIAARWLKQMGLIEDFEIRAIAENRRDFEVMIRTKGSRSLVNLMDVGFGLSQLLPVIVECFCVPAESIVIFEQPEIHLHPKVQASLADLFIEAIRARENGADRNVQLVIESHSEHFLRRLQRRIAEGELTPEDVAVYFCEARGGKSTLQPLDIDDYGNIRNWPEDFFGDEIGDLTAMTEAAMRRQMDEGNE